MDLSRRVSSLKPSSTLVVMGKTKALQTRGVDVVAFVAGEPDFDTPAPIKAAAERAIEEGQTKYMPTAGDAATRKVIADKLVRENGIAGVTPDHVVVTAGAKHAVSLVFQTLLDEPTNGEDPWDVLLPTPAWVSYDPMARLAGGRIVELPTTTRGGFKITPAQLERAITARSRVLVMNSPSNPCGTMYTPDELRALAAVIERAAATVAPDLVVVADEIYEKIVHGGIEHLSMGSLPGIAERTVTINGLSKAYAMTGWRVGYAAGSGEFGRRIAQGIEKLQGQTTTCLPAFIYPAARAALTLCAADVERMRQAFAARAELIAGLMAEIPGLVCPRPTGAFYVFPDISAYLGRTSGGGRVLRTAAEMAEAILEDSHVALVPGEDFGGDGRRHLRLSFACSEQQIREGMSRLKRFFAMVK